MKLSTGKIGFPIEFDNGDKQVIYFNPNDPDLMVRMNNFDKRVSEKINRIEDVELTAEGKPLHEAQIEAFESMQNIIKKELDYAFGGSVSDVVFKYLSPFAIVNGEYFVEQFIKAITPEIEKHVRKSNADVKIRMAKYLNKYGK
jgi:hypothetical protein